MGRRVLRRDDQSGEGGAVEECPKDRNRMGWDRLGLSGIARKGMEDEERVVFLSSSRQEFQIPIPCTAIISSLPSSSNTKSGVTPSRAPQKEKEDVSRTRPRILFINDSNPDPDPDHVKKRHSSMNSEQWNGWGNPKKKRNKKRRIDGR